VDGVRFCPTTDLGTRAGRSMGSRASTASRSMSTKRPSAAGMPERPPSASRRRRPGRMERWIEAKTIPRPSRGQRCVWADQRRHCYRFAWDGSLAALDDGSARLSAGAEANCGAGGVVNLAAETFPAFERRRAARGGFLACCATRGPVLATRQRAHEPVWRDGGSPGKTRSRSYGLPRAIILLHQPFR
jgi:hypothetical protein